MHGMRIGPEITGVQQKLIVRISRVVASVPGSVASGLHSQVEIR